MNCKRVVIFLLIGLVILSQRVESQEVKIDKSSDIVAESYTALHDKYLNQDSIAIDIISSNRKQSKSQLRRIRRDSIRETQNLWLSVIGGPSYTPEASLGVGGALLANFKINKNDTISHRSFLPVGFNISTNGTIVFAGSGTLFFNENKFRIYAKYGYRNEPAHYYGKGYEAIESNHRSDTTTLYSSCDIEFNPRFVWRVRPKFYIGALLDFNYVKISDVNDVMAADSYYTRYKPEYINVGVGATVTYDTRDDIATPYRGVLLNATAKFYSRAFGSDYNFQILDLEYRQFQPLFGRTILAWSVRSSAGINDVPFTELPMFGSPFDLRGYYWGEYRDRCMSYGIAEYRQMFGSEEDYRQGRFYSRLGCVVWAGAGTIGHSPQEWNRWRLNYGAGVRIQIQPRKNFRLDVGKAHGKKGALVYLNMTEAF